MSLATKYFECRDLDERANLNEQIMSEVTNGVECIKRNSELFGVTLYLIEHYYSWNETVSKSTSTALQPDEYIAHLSFVHELFDFLLVNGADVNGNNERKFPLMFACTAHMVEQLIAYGADVTIPVYGEMSILHYYILENKMEALTTLAKQNVNHEFLIWYTCPNYGMPSRYYKIKCHARKVKCDSDILQYLETGKWPGRTGAFTKRAMG